MIRNYKKITFCNKQTRGGGMVIYMYGRWVSSVPQGTQGKRQTEWTPINK